MPIRFPKMHIAQSVVNQILNVADGIPARTQAAPTLPPPAVPNTVEQSSQLDRLLAQPTSDALPGIDQAPDPGGTLNGGKLLDTLLEPEG